MDRIGGHAPNEVFPCASPRAPRYNGVRMRPEWKSWVTEIQVPNTKKRLWLGSYSSAEMAARAYDAAVVCLKGPNDPKLNFPNSLISPDQVRSCTDLKDVKAIAQAAAYAISSSIPAPHATHAYLTMAEAGSGETSSPSQVKPSHVRSDSGYTHDQAPLVTPPDVFKPAELEWSIGRRGYAIEEDFIYSHGDLILFDLIQGEDDNIHAGEDFCNNKIRPHPQAAEEDDHLWEWGLLAMTETFGDQFGASWASGGGVLGLGKEKSSP